MHSTNKLLWRTSALLFGAVMALGTVSCDKYDLDERDPEGWGASIYSFLNESGNYSITTRLIQDLGLAETLNKTGSKTLFASNDEAYKKFFANNKWGVSSYDQLSLAQKKLLLKGSMIDNPYQVADLSSTENRTEGMCMRRVSSSEYLDSVAVVPYAQLPHDWDHNTFWKRFANRNSVVLLKDATTAPMIHFIEDFMNNNKITNEDYDFIFGDPAGTRQPGDAAVNGVKILHDGQNRRCSNGFVHEMNGVIMPLTNMAEVIATTPDLSDYSRLLDRFSFPYYAGKPVTDNYNSKYSEIVGPGFVPVDSVFEKRYFSLKSHVDAGRGQTGKSVKLLTDDYGRQFSSKESGYLTFDPGWNTYFTGDAVVSADERMKNDMAVMLVPTNTAIDNFWNSKDGEALRNEYPYGIHTVPNDIIARILNNNQLQSFVKSVPSKFDNVLNYNNDPMKLEKSDINRVLLANNGAIYVTNKLFAPTEFVTVLNPVTFDSKLGIIDWAIEKNEYQVYLNSLDARYSLIIHDNGSLMYIDPLSVLKNAEDDWRLYEFMYDGSRIIRGEEPVYAKVWQYNSYTGEKTEIPGEDGYEYNTEQLKWRLREILDACIVVHDWEKGDVEFTDNYKYYRTMGYQTIKVTNPSQAAVGGMTVATSRLINEEGGKEIPLSNYKKHENGQTYQIHADEPLQPTFKSVMEMMVNTIVETGEMDEFYQLIYGNADAFVERVRDKKQYSFTDNIKSFNTFHYTVYVPTNASINKWLKDNHLVDPIDPDVKGWDFIETLPAGSPQRVADSTKLVNFVRYHFQDNALFIGAKPESGDYTTGYVITEDLGEGIHRSKFKKVKASLTANGITVQDYEKKGPVRKVLTTNSKAFNRMAREYFFHKSWDGPATSPAECDALYGASSAVLHLIDGPLETDFSK